MTVTSCFVYNVIRDLYSIDHLCISPYLRIGLIYHILLSNYKQKLMSLSLLVGTTVDVNITSMLLADILTGVMTLCLVINFYAPNFENVEGAYCFGLVRPSVSLFKK